MQKFLCVDINAWKMCREKREPPPRLHHHQNFHRARERVQKMNNEDMISSDGYEFVIEKKAALISETISNMLTNSPEGQKELHFPEIRGVILEKVCGYFYWSLQYSSEKRTEFHIEPEIVQELMMAASFLDTKVPNLCH